MHILIADEDGISRKTLAAASTAKGHTVHVAADGAEAWLLFQDHSQGQL
ncbi:MAG: hypothetical protein ABR497_05650 [Kiritimatiellia bacterium]|nr:hypothetical protein [Lentisphaerota bacterium]